MKDKISYKSQNISMLLFNHSVKSPTSFVPVSHVQIINSMTRCQLTKDALNYKNFKTLSIQLTL